MYSLQHGGPREHHITPSLTSIAHDNTFATQNKHTSFVSSKESEYHTRSPMVVSNRTHSNPLASVLIGVWVATNRTWMTLVIAQQHLQIIYVHLATVAAAGDVDASVGADSRD